jgi:hypothetical protein
MKTLAGLIVFSVSVSPLVAQWADRPTPGFPRTADGKPNLSAPAPRTSDGKPDLSGVLSLGTFSRGRRPFTSKARRITATTRTESIVCRRVRRPALRSGHQ